MTELAKFGSVEGDDLSSFSAPPVEKSVVSEASDNTVAAQGALMAGTEKELLATFSSLSNLPAQERQAGMDSITDRVHQDSVRMSQNLAAQMTLNPDLSTKEVEGLVRGMASLQTEKPNSMDLMSKELGVKPDGDEDPVSEDIRIDAVAISDEINATLRERQALLNGNLLSTSTGGLHALADFAEIVIPFSESFITEETVRKMRGGSVGAAVEAFSLLGNAKVGLRDYRANLGHAEQREFDRKLAEVVNASEGIVFTNDNDLAQKDLFMSIVDGNYYGPIDQGIDNIIGILDLVGFGGALRGTKLAAKASTLSKVGVRKLRAKVQPSSPSKVAAEVNPDEARKLQAMAEADESGEVAKTTHGTTREEVVVDAEAPQVRTEDGSVESKPHDLARYVEDFIHSGRIDLSPDEVLSAQRKGVERVQRINGLTNRTNMAQYKSPQLNEDGTAVYQNVYGPADSSYKTPQQGIDNTLFALRDYGVEEADLTVLRKVGDEYLPVTVEEVEARNAIRAGLVKKKKKLPEEFKKANMRDDYLVQVNFEHDFDPMDVEWDRLQVKRNFFDRIPFFNQAKKGKSSVQRHLLDIHSMLDPRITLGANVAVERASSIETALIKNAEAFVAPFNKLDSERQVALMEVIKNDNFSGTKTPYKTLKAKGYSEEEMELLDKWKDSWDQLYHLENLDLVKSLKAGGYQRFVDKSNNTELVARSVGKVNTKGVGTVYDSALGKTVRMSQKEVEDLYESGGTLAILRSAEKVDGKDFDHVLVRNKQNQSMLQDLQETDRVLNYREGYYTVRYKDPHIIIKKVKDSEGNVIRTQAVKTAATKKEAELATVNMNRGNNDLTVEYGFRDNKDRTVGQMEDDQWEINSSIGRTSQRLRGERLGSTDTNIQGNGLGAVEGPADALLNSVRSISRRTAMRDYIERYKQRFMDEYSELVKTDVTTGRQVFPSKAEDFKAEEASSSKRLADARTNLEYINYLENGYRNGLDDSWKAMLNGMADIIGGKTAHGERAIRAIVDEVQSPTTWFKARAFDAYLALNPLRQFVVQGHQASLLAANFTKYVVSQKLARDTAAIHMAMITGDKLKDVKGVEKFMGMSADEALALAEEYRKTGFDASIDRNNLVEAGLDHLVDTENFSRIKKVHKAVVGTNRKIGFDAGERINIMSSWLAHRNRALEGGKDLASKRVRDEVMAKARNYTFNMNAAGDMPYNKNALALLFQFMQVPHKAMLQVTNRALSRTERAKLAAYNAVVLPMPVGIGYSIISSLEIEDEQTRDFIANGLEGFLFNELAQSMFEDDTRVDFSSLAAVDPNAPLDLIHGLLTTDVGEILSNAPALSLWSGYNPRATNIITETYKFVTEPESEDEMTSMELMKTFASFSSGYMNLSKSFRELFVQEYDRRYNSSAGITDMAITTPEMLAKSLGFGSLQEAYSRETKQHIYKASKEARDDVKQLYLAQKQAGARKGVNVDRDEFQQHMLRGFWAATSFTTGQQEEYMKLLMRDVSQGDDGVLGLIQRNLNYTRTEDIMKAAHGAGVFDEVGEVIEYIQSIEQVGDE